MLRVIFPEQLPPARSSANLYLTNKVVPCKLYKNHGAMIARVGDRIGTENMLVIDLDIRYRF